MFYIYDPNLLILGMVVNKGFINEFITVFSNVNNRFVWTKDIK